MISPDDPRLTAHADGMLPPAEADRLERELASAPEARAELERLRALQRALREAFAEETAEDGVFAADGAPAEASEPPPAGAARRRPYSIYRDALDARAEVAGWRPLVPVEDRRGRAGWLDWLFPGWLAPIAGTACVAMLIAAIFVPPVLHLREKASRASGEADLRQVAQAALLFATESAERLPDAADVWDYARQLAQTGGLNAASVWLNPLDPATIGASVITVLNPDRSGLAPAFASTRPSIAVALGGISLNAPATTPVAWTRGLQPDGTWTADSPYGGDGGHIAFLDGSVVYFGQVKNRLVRHDGKGGTSDIREALPPGARIGEYHPTEDEKRAWEEDRHPSRNQAPLAALRRSKGVLLVVAVAGTLFTMALLIHRLRRAPG
jgi:anti-sigma factor RsiW